MFLRRVLCQPASLVVLLICLLFWLAEAVGVLDRSSGWFYDELVSILPAQSGRAPLVALVETPAEGLEPADHLRLLDRLQHLGARQVVFSVTPDAQPAFFARAREAGNVVLGRPLRPQPRATDLPMLAPMPAAASGIASGISGVLASGDGIFRRQAVTILAGGRDASPRTLLEVVAAQEFLGAGFRSPKEPYWIDFSVDAGGLPRALAQDVLAGRLIPELLRGRSVVVGAAQPIYNAGLHIPLRDHGQGISLAEFQARALETLLQDSAPWRLPSWAVLLLLLGLAAVLTLAYQILDQVQALAFTLATVLIHVALAAIVLLLFRLWLPLAAILGVQLALGIVIFSYRKMVQDRALSRLLVHISARVSERAMPRSFYSSGDPWQEVIRLVKQTLGAERQIFLECIPGQVHVREVAADACTAEDIREMRRDYRRAPYVDALELRGPLALSERRFLQPAGDAEQQYLVPLLYAGEPIGFWAFTLDARGREDLSDVVNAAARIGEQIAELMFHRRQWNERQKRHGGRLAQTLRLVSPQDRYRELAQIQGQLEFRLDQMEGVGQALGTAFALYDLFGNLLHVNSAMEEWARNAGLRLFDMSALDFAITLTGRTTGFSRDYLRRLMIERAPLHVAISAPGRPEQRYFLQVRPVPRRRGATDTGSPFDLLGVLFEITDIGPIATKLRMRDELVQRLGTRLQGDLLGLRQLVDALRNRPSPGAVNDALAMLDEDVAAVSGMIGQVREALSADALLQEMSFYPVDPRSCLDRAVQTQGAGLAARNLALKLEFPGHNHMVLADPAGLQQVLEQLLTLLIDDATDGSELRIALREGRSRESAWTVLEMACRGHGFPMERLDLYLRASELDAFARGHPLYQARRQIERWEGRLEGESRVGAGLTLRLHLRGYDPAIDRTLSRKPGDLAELRASAEPPR